MRIHRYVTVTNPEDVSSISGFDGSQKYTQGNGFVPCVFTDAETGKKIPIDIEDADKFDGVARNILSPVSYTHLTLPTN